jgi:hypothetical protein
MLPNMSRSLFYLMLGLALALPQLSQAQDDGPPISITSPDEGTTYALATIKDHSLVWDKSQKMLVARVTFIELDDSLSPSSDDTHDFRLPGVSFDPVKGIFTATTAKGVIIPVAHYKKTLFIKSIEVLPNARVRIVHPRGVITVILEAISPNDPAMHPPADDSDPDATHSVDLGQILN